MKNGKHELSNLTEDFERLNEIFETSRNSSNEVNKTSDIELNKVREEYRIINTEKRKMIPFSRKAARNLTQTLVLRMKKMKIDHLDELV